MSKYDLENYSEAKLIEIYKSTQTKEKIEAIHLIFKERGYSKSEVKKLLESSL